MKLKRIMVVSILFACYQLNAMQKSAQKKDMAALSLLRRVDPSRLDQQQKNHMLNASAFHDDVALVIKFLDHGADLNGQADESLCTPLQAAAGQGNTDVLKELLSRKPQLELANSEGQTALTVAVLSQKVETLVLFLNAGAYIDAVDGQGLTALHYAVLMGYDDLVKCLLERGACVNTCAIGRCTPLHTAAEKGNLVIMGLLLGKGAHIEAQNAKGYTPLHRAVSVGNEQAVLFLLDRKANARARAAGGVTPLHCAVANKRVSLVRLFLQRGIDPEALTDGNITPLMLADKQGPVIIQLLTSAIKSKIGCVVCGNTPSSEVCIKKCGRCMIPSYCSSECQNLDWKEHKRICEKPIVMEKCEGLF